MRLKINLSGFLEEVPEIEAIPYLLKMYLREVLELDIHIDPTDPHDTSFVCDGKDMKYEYHLTDDDFYITLER
jgi:hypothetical protein